MSGAPALFEGWALIDESSVGPEGYYDTQQEAIDAGRRLAGNTIRLVVHDEDGSTRSTSS